MATRAIVTSHPVVACDVCGRRLLRGESPDVFLAGGQRRTVCELCVPRAAAEGWLREADNHALTVRPGRARRTGSLLGRLRQLREPARRPLRRETRPQAAHPAEVAEGGIEEDGLYDFLEGGSIERSGGRGQELYIGSVEAGEPVGDDSSGEPEPDLDEPALGEAEIVPPDGDAPARAVTSGDLKMERALQVFNAGDPPRRVAGVSRSLGSPSVTVRPLEASGSAVAIVVAWELCWYRYEVDLGDEAAGPRLVAQGLELDELPEEDRLGNACADERGELVALQA
ncbi:MAG TPA: hypothetical protein VIG42_00730 [Solirubrobacteraceae bacterium]|jgi:hypothetical protein